MKRIERAAMVLGAFLLPFIVAAADLGEIQGKVIDEKTGDPLPFEEKRRFVSEYGCHADISGGGQSDLPGTNVHFHGADV